MMTKFFVARQTRTVSDQAVVVSTEDLVSASQRVGSVQHRQDAYRTP